MTSFLQSVAQDLYGKTGGDLSHTVVVFPNKRARLFFNEHLAAESSRPLWSPAYVSISELFRRLSPLKVGDPIRLTCELYKVFREETGSEETLDDFYFWGELLIGDFDDVDKNLVEADRLFSNLHDLKNIMDGFDFLDHEQEEAIRHFFRNFSIGKRTELKARFISLWNKLGNIYHRYRERLSALGIAYEGMMYRDAIERIQPSSLSADRYVFVGFNVLNKVEIRLFQLLQEAGKAMFYWDYDTFYTDLPARHEPPYTHEAGEFILRNLKLFPNQLPASCFDTLRRPKRVSYISASTENAQARYLPQWLKSLPHPIGKETAVVLCNESLLLPVLHSIPEEVENINITMGFPVAQTPVGSFIDALMELQTTGYRADTGRYKHDCVLTVLKHPYTRRLSPQAETLEQQLVRNNRFYPRPSELESDGMLAQIFTPQSGNLSLCRYIADRLRDVAALHREESTGTSALYGEALFRSYTLVNRIATLIESGDAGELRPDTLKRLLSRLIASATVPFHGEPAVGLQVMGVLETRNLDFRNLVMLSLNEGRLPKSGSDSSFIPYNLRKAFGMTTIEHRNAIYAYYFYRLIQRAENITLLYNTSSEGLNRGEMSRFMLQFLIEWPHDIERHYIEAGQSPRQAREINVRKTPERMRLLCDAFDLRRNPKALLSPSALNAYLDCRLKFYFRYVAKLTAPDEVNAEIDNALFGTLFHRAAELAYRDLTRHGKLISREELERLLKDDVRLQNYVDAAFKKDFFHVPPTEKPEYNGTQLINSKVILSYLRQLLRGDLRHAPFNMEGMEQPVRETWEIETPQGRLPIQIGGTIDRMDSKEDTLRIVDYKTGGSPNTPENIGQLFTPADDRPGYVFQTFLYAAIMCRQQALKVTPALLYIHRAASDTYSPVIEMGAMRKPKVPVTNFSLLEDDFRDRLNRLLQEIFNPEEPFSQTDNPKMCSRCDFRALCQRKE